MESFSVLHHSVCFVSYIKGFSGNTKKSSRVARGQINYSKILWWLHVMCGVSKHVVSSGLSVSPPSHHHHHWSSWIPKKSNAITMEFLEVLFWSFDLDILRISMLCLSKSQRHSASVDFARCAHVTRRHDFCSHSVLAAGTGFAKKNCFIFKLLSLQLNIFNISYV